jgi:hypothetical protein
MVTTEETSEFSTTTSTTSTVTTTTTTTNVNIVISAYTEILPYENNQIIIMATVIPVLWVACIVAFFWAKRSTDIIGGIFHPFNNLSRSGKSWGSYELRSVSEA